MEEFDWNFSEKIEEEEDFKLTPSQQRAYDFFETWIEEVRNDQLKDEIDQTNNYVLRINGEAGTGKTYLMKHVINKLNDMNISVAPIAYTGKAASKLMQSTGCPSCTIHKLIYTYDLSTYEFFESSQDEQEAFDNNRVLSVLKCKCLIIDEYSMLTKEILTDLKKLDKILIFIGDLNQLPPIKEEVISDEEFNDLFDTNVPVLTLSDPVRQSEDSPILSLARDIKNGLTVLKPQSVQSVITLESVDISSIPKADIKAFGSEDTIIICYKNKTKHFINKRVRKSLGYNNLLNENDKIIIMKNNSDYGVYNGEMYKVLEIGQLKEEYGLKYTTIKINNDYEPYIKVWLNPLIDNNYFYQTTGINDEMKKEQYFKYKEFVHIAYAYAITCHKAQGSEWETVYVRYDDAWKDKKRWLYTAITRARKHLIIRI